MSEPTLTLDYQSVYNTVGFFFFGTWTPDGDNLKVSKYATLQAYRKFLAGSYPENGPYKQMRGRSHKWSFLPLKATVLTVANQAANDLPEDYGGLALPFAYGATDNNKIIMEVGDAWIDAQLSGSNTPTGPPSYFAIRAKTFAEATAERYEVRWWFVPDSGYTLTYGYDVSQAEPSAPDKYLVGSGQYGHVIVQMAIAEGELMLRKVAGPQRAEADRMLAAAIEDDMATYGPVNIGYAGDGPGTDQAPRHSVRDDVTVSGW